MLSVVGCHHDDVNGEVAFSGLWHVGVHSQPTVFPYAIVLSCLSLMETGVGVVGFGSHVVSLGQAGLAPVLTGPGLCTLYVYINWGSKVFVTGMHVQLELPQRTSGSRKFFFVVNMCSGHVSRKAQSAQPTATCLS